MHATAIGDGDRGDGIRLIRDRLRTGERHGHARMLEVRHFAPARTRQIAVPGNRRHAKLVGGLIDIDGNAIAHTGIDLLGQLLAEDDLVGCQCAEIDWLATGARQATERRHPVRIEAGQDRIRLG